MFAIQAINRFYKINRYFGVRDNGLPFLVYEGNSDYPKAIHRFKTQESAERYLTEFIQRKNIDMTKISLSERIDIILCNNSNKFQIVEFNVDNDKMVISNTYKLPQFDRKDWY